MKKLLFIIFAFIFSSCSIYNVGYTPDDLYFSIPTNNSTSYVDLHDRYLSMKVYGTRWNRFDDDFYYWNNRPMLPYYYSVSPVYIPTYIIRDKNTKYQNNNGYRQFNLNTYDNSKPNTPMIKSNTPAIRQFNLNTYDKNKVNTPTTPIPNKSAPIRKF